MAFGFKNFFKGIRIFPKTTSQSESQGDIESLSTDGKLRYHNGTSNSPVVTEAHAATITNKTIDADDNIITDLEVDNLKAGVLNTDDALTGATDTQIPSALAVKTFVEDSASAVQADVDDLVVLSGVPINSTDLGTFTGVTIPDGSNNKEAFQALETAAEADAAALAAHIADPSDAHDASAISVSPAGNLVATDVQSALSSHQTLLDALQTLSGVSAGQTDLGVFTGDIIPNGSDIKEALQAVETAIELNANADVQGPASATDNAIARYDGTTGKVIQDSPVTVSDAGAIAGATQLDVDNIRVDGNTISATDSGNVVIQPGGFAYVDLSGNTILAANKYFAAVPVNNSATGANATVTVNGKNICLVDAGLTSIDMLVADAFGKEVTLINRTGTEVTINHNTGSTPAYRIYTGTGANVTLPIDGAFSLVYDGTAQRWNLIGGTGSGEGGGTTDPDVIIAQTFDDVSLSDFMYDGAEIATTDSMHGAQSIKFTHSSLLPKYIAQSVLIDPKFRGVNVTASILVRSTASDGNLVFSVEDLNTGDILTSQNIQTDSVQIASMVITNGVAVIGGFSNSDINYVQPGMSVTGTGIQSGTTIVSVNTSTNSVIISQAATSTTTTSLRFSALPKTVQLGFNIPADCTGIIYQVSALEETGSPETYIDDICIKNYFLGMSNQGQSEISVDTIITAEPSAYSPTITTSSGTMTNYTATATQQRIGNILKVKGTITFTGAPGTWNNPRIGLPAGLTASTPSQSALIEGGAGFYDSSAGIAYQGFLYSYASTNTAVDLTGPGFTAISQAAPFAWAVNDVINFQFEVPIVGWEMTETQSFQTTDLVPAKAVLGNTAITVPVITDWTDYTPTFTGFGSTTVQSFKYRQVGNSIEIDGKFTVGTPTGVEARISLPSTYTSTAFGGTIKAAGTWTRNTLSSNNSFQLLIEPSTSYVTFGWNGASVAPLTKQNGSQVAAAGESFSVRASVEITGLSATEEITISGTQAGTVEEDDCHYQINGFTPARASTNTAIVTLGSAGTIVKNVGDHITVATSATLGDTFTATKTGIYTINFSGDLGTTAVNLGFSKNSTQLTTDVTAITITDRLSVGYDNGSNSVANVSWSGYLVAGDVIRLHTGNIAFAGPSSNYNTFSISYQGKLTQVNVNADQKIKIPTSELRFEGASSRGATATAVVKFDSIAKIRGDAFTVTNTTADGTYVTMTKAGKLDVNAGLYVNSASGFVLISKNQAILTTNPTASETLGGSGTAASGTVTNVSWSGFVNAGDVIRVISANGNPTTNVTNVFNLSFQEQDIQVSVSNTLPQFSESDSCLRVYGSAGLGSTNNSVRRFSSTAENIGADVVYTDSATEGGKFVIQTSGIYHITYTESTSATSWYFGITKNCTTLTNATTVNNYNPIERLAMGATDGTANYAETCSWTGYLVAGDIIRAQTQAVAGVTSTTQFTITKIGKPNVTGVDVTPFIEIPQPDRQSTEYADSSSAASPDFASNITASSGSGLYSLSGATLTALKRIHVGATFGISGTATATASATGPRTSISGSNGASSTNRFTNMQSGIGGASTSSINTELAPGQTLTFSTSNTNFTNSTKNVSIVASALSDQILTPPETFNSDTAAFNYAGSSTYTISTLANAPVGTFITYTFTASTVNTKTQSNAAAPTQTTASMNAGGILLTARAYTGTGSTALPPYFAIQIGKGHKGVSLHGYQLANKGGENLSLTPFREGTTGQYGLMMSGMECYNAETGILILDAGTLMATTISSRGFWRESGNVNTDVYITINASKNPALTGITPVVPRVAVLAGQNAATPVASTYVTRTLTFNTDPTGIVSSLTSNQFTLPAGSYLVQASSTHHRTNSSSSRIRNITDSTTAISGVASYASTTAATGMVDALSGVITISSAKVFEFQSICENSTNASYSIAAGTDYVNAVVTITKLK